VANLAPIRLLLVEDDDADLLFVREALAEAGALGAWRGARPIEVLCAGTIEEACDLAFDGGFDAVLLNLSLPDSLVLHETFQRVAQVVPSLPILVLADEEDAALDSSLLREGAQDVLVKPALDAAPLALAIQHALERQRFVNAVRGAVEQAGAPAPLPHLPGAAVDDDLLLSLIHVTGVSANAPDAETVMLAD